MILGIGRSVSLLSARRRLAVGSTYWELPNFVFVSDRQMSERNEKESTEYKVKQRQIEREWSF